MRQTIYLDKIDNTIARIIQASYPEYRGKKIKLAIGDDPIDMRSYWDGGSRDYFRIVNLATFEIASIPAQSAFDKVIPGADAVKLPDGFACVQHSIFCGKDSGLTIMIGSANAAPLLPAPSAELNADQTLVLLYTVSLKSSYAGKDRCEMAREDMDYARRVNPGKPAPITRDAWNAAKQSLIADGYLNKAGAILPKGRNAIGNKYV